MIGVFGAVLGTQYQGVGIAPLLGCGLVGLQVVAVILKACERLAGA